jgi:hypothetical protein
LDQKVKQDLKVTQVHKVQQALKEILEHKVDRALQVLPALLVIPEELEILVHPVL